MSLIAKENGNGDFTPLSAGMHAAVCYGIIDLGTQSGGQFGPKRKCAFLWEVPGERITLERDGKKADLPRGTSAIYTLSLSTKGLLRPMLESWRGRPFTAEELKGFDLKTVLGANCFLNIVHAPGSGTNAGKTYANVKSVNPLAKGMPKLKAENPLTFFSIDECEGMITVPATVPDWIKGKILLCDEVVKQAQHSGNAEPTDAEAANQTPGADEDIPF
jgi:hypothetical protein